MLGTESTVIDVFEYLDVAKFQKVRVSCEDSFVITTALPPFYSLLTFVMT